MKMRFIAALATATFVGLTGSAQATSISFSIGPDNGCVADCLNSTWSLTVSDETVANAGYNLHVTFSVEWPDPGDLFLDENGPFDPNIITAVEFGIPGKALDAMIIDPIAWTNNVGPLNGTGCGGKNGNFTCSEGIAAIVMGSGLSWEWDILVDDPDEVLNFADAGDFHLGAKLEYDGGTSTLTTLSSVPEDQKVHDTGWLLSVSPTNPVPEPTSGLLYFAGVLVAGSRLRRLRQ